MKLVYSCNKQPVIIGDLVKTFRGEPAIILGFTKPHKPSSTGRVFVEFIGGGTGEYFPSVIDTEWIEREDQGNYETRTDEKGHTFIVYA